MRVNATQYILSANSRRFWCVQSAGRAQSIPTVQAHVVDLKVEFPEVAHRAQAKIDGA